MPDLSFEQDLYQQGYDYIAGVDEVGRGPLAGPLVAAAVILPAQIDLPGLNDSKKLSERQRLQLSPLIQAQALDYSIGIVTADVIDRINILQATYLAMWRALRGLNQVNYALIDGNKLIPHWDGPQQAIIKGDSKSLSIAAASVLAKVTRDQIMKALEDHYPGYGLAKHMGYPTAFHRSQVQVLGLSPQHRRSFCKKLIEVAKS